MGEAGSLLAADLARAGDEVHGYDPTPVPPVEGVRHDGTAEAAVSGAGLVLAVTPGSQARFLLEQVAPHIDGTIYADLSTSAPSTKLALAEKAGGAGASFADVALMSAVPGHGLATPALASGTGAADYARLVNERGGSVEVVGGSAGEAAARKLLRSVVMKGLAALLIESTEAAGRYGQADWFRAHITHQLASIDEEWMERLLSGTATHSGRRIEEMEAARDLVTDLGVPATMTTAVIDHLRRLRDAAPGSAPRPDEALRGD